jgi:hypothetical protein
MQVAGPSSNASANGGNVPAVLSRVFGDYGLVEAPPREAHGSNTEANAATKQLQWHNNPLQIRVSVGDECDADQGRCIRLPHVEDDEVPQASPLLLSLSAAKALATVPEVRHGAISPMHAPLLPCSFIGVRCMHCNGMHQS